MSTENRSTTTRVYGGRVIATRAATVEDGPAIARVQLDTWQATYGEWLADDLAAFDLDRTAASWARAAQNPDQRVMVAERDGEIIAYAWSAQAGEAGEAGFGELAALYVLPGAQGLGAGGLLVADSLQWCRANDFRDCLVWAIDRYAPARAFYEKQGFRLVPGATRPWRGLIEVRYERSAEII